MATIGRQGQEAGDTAADDDGSAGGLLAASGLVGAVLASSCCILPLVLVLLGVGGAWMSGLTALEPYRLYFLASTAVLLGAAFWQLYVRRRPACASGDACAKPPARRLTKSLLWTASLLFVLAASVNLWGPLFY